MNPWKEVVLTAHDVLDNSDAELTVTYKPRPLVVRINEVLEALIDAREQVREAEANYKLAEQQLMRQAETIRRLQPKPPPEETSDAPPPPTIDQFNAAVIKEVKRRSTAKKEKREEEGL
jgi:hypothetical protein